MRVLFVMALLTVPIFQASAFAEIQTFTATHTYVLGDHDSKDDARQRCLLETKRKILEQAGVYIESVSEVKNFDLTKDKITSFAAAVMQVKDTKEAVGFEQGHMTMTLTTTAQVDLTEVRKQLATRQVDAGVREDVAVQKDRLKYLEAQLEAIQRQIRQTPGRTPSTPTSDIAAYVQTLRTQAAQGRAEAQFYLGTLYHFGFGMPEDYIQARQWYEIAAGQGLAKAQFYLGTLYHFGDGVLQDYVQSAKWFEKAAAQGLAEAQFYLGTMYFSGNGAPQDYTQARQWYQKAAAQGNEYAQYNLGKLYANAFGVPQDYVQAAKWFEKAAAQGVAEAQGNLGNLYLNGRGVPQDYLQAAKWFEKAAAQGDAVAQFSLGFLHEYGVGVPQDDVLACMWFNLAAASSKGEAQKLATDGRDRITLRMAPAQIAEAQTLAREWKPKR